MLKKYKWPIIAGVVIIVGAIYVLWNPPSTKVKYEYWKGSYAELKRITATDEFVKLKVITDLREQNALLQSSIDSANTIIAKLEQTVVVAEANVAEARKGWAAFSAECQAKLKELDLSWSAVHKIDRDEIAELKRVNFDLTAQYKNALSIGANYQNLFESEKTLRLKCEVGIGLSDKRIASLQKTVRLTRYAALAVIVATVFLVKK